MPLIRDPTLFVYISMPRMRQGLGRPPDEDQRRKILNQIDSFAHCYNLTERWNKHKSASAILTALHKQSDDYSPLVNFLKEESSPRREEPGPAAGSPSHQSLTYASHQCLIYAYTDALIVQIVLGKFLRADEKSVSLECGLRTLLLDLSHAFPSGVLKDAQHDVLGISAVYWGMADGVADKSKYRELYSEESQRLLGGPKARCTQTDVGPLWRAEAKDAPREFRVFDVACEDSLSSEESGVFLDQWVLVTPQAAETQVNQWYNQPRVDGPADFVRVALARHKFAFERTEYDRKHAELEAMREGLRGGARQIIASQVGQFEGLGELRGRTSLDFQKNLTRAAYSLADYRHGISQVRELHRTLGVNLRNFRVHCPLVISTAALAKIDASADREQEASRILDSQGGQDEIFKSEIGQMQSVYEQLETYLDYAQQVVTGHTAALQSGMDLLRIATERTIGEMSYLHGIEAAVVVAAVVAAIAVDILKGVITPTLLRFDVVMLAVVGSFSLMRVVSAQARVKPRWERFIWAATVGFLVAGVVEGLLHRDHVRYLFRVGWDRIVLNVIAFFAGSWLFLRLVSWIEKKTRPRSDGPTAGP